MGATLVEVNVTNPADVERQWKGTFLVDTGATDCYIPSKFLRAIGIRPVFQRDYELADGTMVTMDVGVAQLEVMGEVVGATVIFGNDDSEALLGVTVLESAGIEVDPGNQRLKKLPTVRLKSIAKATIPAGPPYRASSEACRSMYGVIRSTRWLVFCRHLLSRWPWTGTRFASSV